MVVYVDYERFKKEYLQTQNMYNAILKEKELLFAKTQPKSSIWGECISIQQQGQRDLFDEYLILKEKKFIDKRLSEAWSLLEDRKKLFILKQQELMDSKSDIDKIYRMRYIKRMNVSLIAITVKYSESQVYRILSDIKHAIITI